MRKNLLFIASALYLASCAPGGGIEELQGKLKEKEGQLKAIKEEIASIKGEIKDHPDYVAKNEKRTLIVAGQPKKAEFIHYLKLPGRADSRQNVTIGAEANGTIQKIYFHEGSYVSKGQTLASIDAEVIRTQIEELKTQLDLATDIFDRQKSLWDKKIGSELQYLQAKNNKEALEKRISSAKAQLDMTRIVAPMAGYIDEVFVREGQMVGAGTPAVRLVNLDRITVNVDVSERYIGTFEKGDTARVSFSSLGLDLKAPITAIGQVVDQDNRTFTVEIMLDNSDRLIKPNILADVMIADYRSANAMIVPTNIIQQGKHDEYVYVVAEDEKGLVAQKKSISKGVTYQGTTEVLKGLSLNDKIITIGGRDLTDGEPIRMEE